MSRSHLIRKGELSQVFAVIRLGLDHQVACFENENLIRFLRKSVHNTGAQIVYLGIDKADVVSSLAHDVAESTLEILVFSLYFQESYLVLKGEQEGSRLFVE